jgi:hypothetical protein
MDARLTKSDDKTKRPLKNVEARVPNAGCTVIRGKKRSAPDVLGDIEDLGASLSPMQLRRRNFLKVSDFAKTEYCSLKVSDDVTMPNADNQVD